MPTGTSQRAAIEMQAMKTETSVNGDEQISEKEESYYSQDGSVDYKGCAAVKATTGGQTAGFLILLNQGFATVAFFGVGVNLVLFLTRVMQQSNADAANSVSKWTGTVYLFSLVGAFLSDSYWGRYKTCVVFQVIFVAGLAVLSLSSYFFLVKPAGCGRGHDLCDPQSSWETGVFYLSMYLVALGNGGYQPNIATFGADQFDEQDSRDAHSKVAFFSYFYLAFNLGSLVSDTFLSYIQDKGLWVLSFWASVGSAFLALILFLAGSYRYRHFKPGGNPLSRVTKVVVAASMKWAVKLPASSEHLYSGESKDIVACGARAILHTKGFRFLDRAAVIGAGDFSGHGGERNSWRLCTVTQVEELKCLLRLLPIWLCTITYSVVFTQMASLFVEQGAAMNANVGGFHVPPASMSVFNIVSVAVFTFFYRSLLHSLFCRIRNDPKGLTELQRMGIGLIIAFVTMVAAGTVEQFRLRFVSGEGGSSLNIMCQIPQYVLLGASEVFMYVGQLEFFNSQTPDGLKSFGSALCMTSISLGNYVSSILVTVVMDITAKGERPGWIPGNLNKGNIDRFYYLLAAMTVVDWFVFLFCARRYKPTRWETREAGSGKAVVV